MVVHVVSTLCKIFHSFVWIQSQSLTFKFYIVSLNAASVSSTPLVYSWFSVRPDEQNLRLPAAQDPIELVYSALRSSLA